MTRADELAATLRRVIERDVWPLADFTPEPNHAYVNPDGRVVGAGQPETMPGRASALAALAELANIAREPASYREKRLTERLTVCAERAARLETALLGEHFTEAVRLGREIKQAEFEHATSGWGGYPWEHLGDASRDIAVLIRGLLVARAALDDGGTPDE